MSLSCTSSSSSGALVSKIAPVVLSFLYPVDFAQASCRRIRRKDHQPGSFQKIYSAEGLEAWFVNSLASAAHCRQHNSTRRSSICIAPRRPNVVISGNSIYKRDAFRRHQHAKVSVSKQLEQEPEPEPNRTKEELMALVDQYDGYLTDQLSLLEPPSLYQPSDGPHLTVSDKVEDEWPPPRYAWPADPITKTKLKTLETALVDIHKDPEEIYRLYKDLPKPHVPYLEAKVRHKLLRHLSIVERKDEQSMLRYFSVLDDMKVTAIPLSVKEWTSAISFAARYVSRSTEVEVEAALHMWREMEHTAGVKGNEATLNVLFDVACKAGKFNLAEMIYKEMRARGLEFNRYHHVSLIYFYGLKRNGDGVRAAYKALVEAGEVVDTVVLNATISGLLMAQEENAAENIYERMKRVHAERGGTRLPPRDYKNRRMVNKVLMNLACELKSHPERREQIQQQSIIAPDMQTYRILVNHFAVRSGELHKATKFLDEMKWFKLPLHGAIFLALLKGFAYHGGIRYTHWTEERLESVWKAFLQAVDNDTEDLYISTWIAIWALKAFAKCSGKSRMADIWEELKEKWNPEGEDLEFMMSIMRRMLDGEDMLDKRDDWLLGV